MALLEKKVALIYGAGGPVGGAVARAFAREGAKVFLSGRSFESLDAVAERIRAAGGTAETDRVDALDEQAVDLYVDAVAERAGRIDISFNLISYGDVQAPLMEISAEDFLRPVVTATRTHFLTTRAAARHMIPRGSGVILAFGGSGPHTLPELGGFKIALDALEGQRRQWSSELGRHGIRFVTLKTGGVPETIPEGFPGRTEMIAGLERASLLTWTANLADVGHVAAFVASDRARTMTAATVNISCGAIMDY
ncbi:SDR family NAD(P)-dependent oxidoreductase [Streptomyces sp. NPDC002536]